MERVALDTTFLIDLQRERANPRRSLGALAFLESHGDTELLLPVITLAEYLEGFEAPHDQGARTMLGDLEVLPIDEEVAILYARIARKLRRSGQQIGTNDLWIGCTALAADAPLLTRNVDELRRIPGLSVVGYHPRG